MNDSNIFLDDRLTLWNSSALTQAQADLTWLNTADVLRAFGVQPAGRTAWHGPLEVLVRQPAQHLARQLIALDQLVGMAGLQAGGAWICGRMAAAIEISGPPPPHEGPLLIVANHPGLLDAVALFAAIPRRDLRVLAITRPLLRALPQIAAHLIPVGDTPAARSTALRSAARHLRSGGALLTFPAGRIEPDPLTMDGALESLDTWAGSIDLLSHLGGRPALIPMIVGGAIAPWAVHHPLTHLRRLPDDRRWMAAIVQLLAPQHARARVHVRRGMPLPDAGEQRGPAAVAAARTLMRELRR